MVGFRGADAAGQIEPAHGGNPARLFDELLPVGFERGEHATHDAAGAQVADEGARVEIADDGYTGPGKEGIGRGIAAPVAGHGGKLADHETLDVWTLRLVVGGAGSVIADLGIGQDHDLAGIRGVGEDFLIAGECGIEDNFAASLGGRTKTPALEDAPVFQGEYCSGQFRLFLPGSG